MTIPSSVLLDEIKQMGFSPKPYLSELGEVCIGFGHRLMDDVKLLSKFDEDLANMIKFYDKAKSKQASQVNSQEHQDKLIAMVLDCDLEISKKKAEKLLLNDIFNIFELLVEKSSGFRRLTNLCNGNYTLLNPPLSRQLIRNKNKELWDSPEYVIGVEKKNNKKNLDFKITNLPNARGDAAAIRLDSIVYLSYLLGIKTILNMKVMLASLRLDDYHTASSSLLTHSSSQKLKSKMVLLSRRLRYGIMYCNLSEPLPFEEIIEPVEEEDDELDFFCTDYEKTDFMPF